MLLRFLSLFPVMLIPLYLFAQADSGQSNQNWSAHFQTTIIGQQHNAFPSLYRGEKSLIDTVEPVAVSLTATLFLGRRLWKGAAVYFNPEVAGGRGLSFATGAAGALNGETYRVGAVEPVVFIARAYLQQHIPIGHSRDEFEADDQNQLAGKIPSSRITISLGKFAMSDFFDDNRYAKDPRKQFFNWSVWGNGAWDYPADTRGYTEGIVAELIKLNWSLRFSTVAVPKVANSPDMEYKLFDAHSETIEFQHRISIAKRPGNVRFIFSNTANRAPSYEAGINALVNQNTYVLDIIKGEAENQYYGGHKIGLGFNFEQEVADGIGVFSRIGWNDGKYATWAFTEIDQTITAGISIAGMRWKRPHDVIGFAIASNGISQGHRDFLRGGGYGFIIGDGALNYGSEFIMETYYSARFKFLWLTLDLQFVNNPAYNRDRGPVFVYGLRGHIEI